MFADALKVALREVLDERDQAHSSVSYPFSKVGEEAAASIYADLGITIIDGNELEPLSNEVLDCGSFDMSAYANKEDATSDFLQHISKSLQKNGVRMGCRDGFKVEDIHGQSRLYRLKVQGKLYVGGLDGVILPYGVAKASASSQFRAGIELKHSEVHKARFKERMGKGPCSGSERHIQFTGSVQGQALVETMAAAVYAEYPEAMLLQSSFDHNAILLLSKGTVTMWQPVSFNAAMAKMGQFLKQCSTHRAYIF